MKSADVKINPHEERNAPCHRGMAYFIYGKKQSHLVALVAGLALMVVPYFLGNPYLLSAICVAIMLAPKFIKL
jgi:hypothetical protein